MTDIRSQQMKENISKCSLIVFKIILKALKYVNNFYKRKKRSRKLYSAFCKEEGLSRLKSCSLWLREGDMKTSFLHNQAKARDLNNVKEIQIKEAP